MLNQTVMDGSLTGDAVASVTANAYNAYNLVSVAPILLGTVGIILFIFFLATQPNKIKHLILGYLALSVVGMGLLLLYGVLKSLDSIGKAVVFDFIKPLGQFLLDYFVYIVVTLPLAYYTGKKVEPLLNTEYAEETK